MTRILFIALALLIAMPSSAQKRRKRVKKPKVEVVEEPVKTPQENLFDEMLFNTQRITVIDSLVLPKSQLLPYIPLSNDLGRIEDYNSFFATQGQPDSYVYVNGFGSKCFYSENNGKAQKLYTRNKLGQEWSKANELEGLSVKADTLNYPFMTSDGTTFYFAAISPEGLGGYDIYVTRYDADNGRFYKAENLGLPINSSGNDYLYVEDETHNLAWFASDRNQPEGKVCLYTIIPPSTRTNYDNEVVGDSIMRSLARLERIRDTWTDKTQVEEAQQRLSALGYKEKNTTNGTASCQPVFIVNDNHVIYNANELSSSEARVLFVSLNQSKQNLKDTLSQLDDLRIMYNAANAEEKKRLEPRILESEKAVEQLRSTIKKQEKELRKLI